MRQNVRLPNLLRPIQSIRRLLVAYIIITKIFYHLTRTGRNVRLQHFHLLDAHRWEQANGTSSNEHTPAGIAASKNGFGGISRRTASCKPLIAAVVGGAYGGGVEMLLNCDLVIAAEDATFALPEVKVGVTVASGGAFVR